MLERLASKLPRVRVGGEEGSWRRELCLTLEGALRLAVCNVRLHTLTYRRTQVPKNPARDQLPDARQAAAESPH